MKKYVIGINKLFIGLIIGIVVTSIVAMASNYAASSIVYDNSTSGLSSTYVQGALQELYTKAANKLFQADRMILTVEGNGLTEPYQSFILLPHQTINVTVTPSNNYYISGYSCNNDYVINHLITGENATETQTISITNYGGRKDCACTLTLEDIGICPSCIYTRPDSMTQISNTIPSSVTTYENYTELDNYASIPFLGISVNSNNNINTLGLCAVEDNNPFCLIVKGGSNSTSSIRKKLIDNLNNVFSNCTTETEGAGTPSTSYKTTCDGTSNYVSVNYSTNSIYSVVVRSKTSNKGCNYNNSYVRCGNINNIY